MGPQVTVELPTTTVDWEVEMVAVIGRRAFRAPAAHAWSHVAGLMVGQDLSERASQFAGELPQFSIAKSSPGFGPTGPWLTTLDDIGDPADLAISCRRNGEVVQSDRTASMVHGVDALIADVSAATPLFPGDLVFTGTPGGTGHRPSLRSSSAPAMFSAAPSKDSAVSSSGSSPDTTSREHPATSTMHRPWSRRRQAAGAPTGYSCCASCRALVLGAFAASLLLAHARGGDPLSALVVLVAVLALRADSEFRVRHGTRRRNNRAQTGHSALSHYRSATDLDGKTASQDASMPAEAVTKYG